MFASAFPYFEADAELGVILVSKTSSFFFFSELEVHLVHIRFYVAKSIIRCLYFSVNAIAVQHSSMEDIMYLHSVFAAGLYQQDLDDFQWNIWPWMRLDVDTISPHSGAT